MRYMRTSCKIFVCEVLPGLSLSFERTSVTSVNDVSWVFLPSGSPPSFTVISLCGI